MLKKSLAPIGTLALVALLVPAPAAAGAVTPMRIEDAGAFTTRLGEARTGGAYVDPAGRAVVTVTDAAGAQSVREAGGVARVVGRSMRDLRSVTTVLDESARIPGTSWGVDPATNQVVVEMDSTVTGTKLDRLQAATASFGDAVRVDRIAGELLPAAAFTSGGQGIQNKAQTRSCSIGFNVRDRAGAKFFVTAGHCGKAGSAWHKGADGTYLGTMRESSFPGNDYAVVPYRNSAVSAYGTVWVDGVGQQISSSRYPVNGEPVSRVGTTSSDLAGTVLLTDVTVNYSDQTVTGLIKTSLCAEFGDSGGALFHGSVALGITSGASGADQACSTPVRHRHSYYQPVQEVLDRAGLTVF